MLFDAMTFKGKNLVRSKILINEQIVEQVSLFSYLGCKDSLEFDKDIEK